MDEDGPDRRVQVEFGAVVVEDTELDSLTVYGSHFLTNALRGGKGTGQLEGSGRDLCLM